MKYDSQIKEILTEAFCFRDYEIKSHTEFRRFTAIGVHTLIDMNDEDLDLYSDLADSIETFSRGGYPMIYIYVKPVYSLKSAV